MGGKVALLGSAWSTGCAPCASSADGSGLAGRWPRYYVLGLTTIGVRETRDERRETRLDYEKLKRDIVTDGRDIKKSRLRDTKSE